MTAEEEYNRVQRRIDIFEKACELVAPIIERHGVENYKIGNQVMVHGTTMTKSEQHIDHILRVADWLLES